MMIFLIFFDDPICIHIIHIIHFNIFFIGPTVSLKKNQLISDSVFDLEDRDETYEIFPF